MARSETTEHSPSHEAAIDQRGGERRAGMRAQRTQRTTERSLHVGMMMVLARYGWEHGPGAPPISVSTARGRPSTTATTTRSCPTLSSC
jgi:hypothetical protein